MGLKNKIVIVTASSRGIGHAIVTRFAKEGARVYLDATVKESYQSAIDEVMVKEGRVAVLVNNFGTSDPLIASNILLPPSHLS